jgi:DNA-binding response OmpR family regulator
MRILQVEDDPFVAESTEKMLAAKGHQCATTPYGEDAVERATSESFDLILLDIMLPDIDGYEVLRRLGQAGVTTPVVIQTGLVRREDADKGASLGTKYYLLKPFSKDELSACIDAAVSDTTDAPVNEQRLGQREADRRETFRDTGRSRRQQPRTRTLKSAQIVYNNQTCLADCVVINTSEGGAALQLNDFFEYPVNFLLKVHRGPTHSCEVCWQRGNKVGVRFLET